jgi:mannan endo-1,6-alpha-mannosidase
MLAPFTASTIMPWLQSSAIAAVGRCAGTAPGIVCGRRWYRVDNEDPDIGHQMTVMSVVQSNLIQHASELADLKTGTSVGDVGGGSIDKPATAEEVLATRPISTGEKVGGWTITTVLFVLVAGGAGFLVASDNEMGLFPSWYSNRS